jgi:hypothetical protein
MVEYPIKIEKYTQARIKGSIVYSYFDKYVDMYSHENLKDPRVLAVMKFKHWNT